MLLALRNPAKYVSAATFRAYDLKLTILFQYKDGKIEEVESQDLMGTAKPYFIYPGYAFVAYPNRDSTPYVRLGYPCFPTKLGLIRWCSGNGIASQRLRLLCKWNACGSETLTNTFSVAGLCVTKVLETPLSVTEAYLIQLGFPEFVRCLVDMGFLSG